MDEELADVALVPAGRELIQQVVAPADAPSPFPAIQWIKESPNTKLLAQLAAEGHPLTTALCLPPGTRRGEVSNARNHGG
ncbi:hypothetical protein [Streptomyces sp. MNU89]|uniref:hypothetical protein n=1 Tax=Streptomyces sp. MNU89 TaxID=2560025 RepID=UPI001E478A5D|nr:hypothetical protein [Streptomyces sp. MNU89]MCC9742399.1 hypothetical protein [Streptomyces sp. MNU89]